MNRLLVVLISLTAGAVQASAFDHLSAVDRPASWPQEYLSFESALEAARSGDGSARVLIARRLYLAGRSAKAAELFHEIHQEGDYAGFDPRLYTVFARMLFGNEDVKPDPALGFQWLVHNAHLGDEAAVAALKDALSSSRVVPRSGDLAQAWNGDDPETPGAGTEEADRPADKAFGRCENYLGRGEEILAIYRDAQRAILENPGRAEAIREDTIDRILAFDPLPPEDGASRITVKLWDASPGTLLKLLSFAGGSPSFKVDHHADEPELGTIMIHALSVPRPLVFARLQESLDIRVQCARDWVRIVNGSSPTNRETSKPFILANFIRSIEPIADTDDQLIRWFGNKDDEGAIWRGGARGLEPQGEGALDLGYSLIEGHFARGRPDGEARWRPTGGFEYRGEFTNGLFHGQGHLTRYAPRRPIDSAEKLFVGQGRFEYGEFQGRGMQRLPSGQADGFVTYEGPFRNGVPHGTGVCRADDVRYDCRFAEGALKAVADVDLTPGGTATEFGATDAAGQEAICGWEQAIRRMARFRTHGRAARGESGLKELAEADRKGMEMIERGDYIEACRWFSEAGHRSGFNMGVSPQLPDKYAQEACTAQLALEMAYQLQFQIDELSAQRGLVLEDMRDIWLAAGLATREDLAPLTQLDVRSSCVVLRPLLAAAMDINHVATWFGDESRWR